MGVHMKRSKHGGNASPLPETLEPRRLLSAAPHVAVTQTNLVSNQPGVAAFTDANLQNGWGISFLPGAEFWVSSNGAGLSAQYDGTGAPAPPPVVTLPGGTGSTQSFPTGQAYAGGAMSFNGTPELFVFVGEDGAISAWNGTGTAATTIRDNAGAGAVYKGAAVAHNAAGQTNLFAANFHSGAIEVYDNTFAPVTPAAGAFSDKKIPKGYAPFNVQDVGGNLVVTYAKQDAAKSGDVKGNGHGFVDIFTTAGTLVRRLAHGAFMNSPWGVAAAPSTWGALAGDILVGQFGNGRIDVFNAKGKFVGLLRDAANKPLAIDGLWALSPGSGSATAPATDIFFSAGPHDEADGLFGKLSISTTAAGQGSNPGSNGTGGFHY